MAGVVKSKYITETLQLYKKISTHLNKIAKVLPKDYNAQTILKLYKEFYPYQWETLEERYSQYQEKDDFLIGKGKKKRYFHKPPEKFLLESKKMQHMLSKAWRNSHTKNFNEVKQRMAYDNLKLKRTSKIELQKRKLEQNTSLIQNIEPVFLEILILSYHKKGTSLKEKVEILNEIKRYRSDETIRFLQKLNDSERNNQLRRLAFNHLQSLGVNVTLRRNFKGKTKKYETERDIFNVTPKELAQRITENTIQSKKRYDIFISHSSKDTDIIISIKNIINNQGLSVYCDWISDDDYLKRELASEYTKIVLKARIEQSDKFILVETKNSLSKNNKIKSKWIKMEIEHASKLGKFIHKIKETAELKSQLLEILNKH